MVFVSTVIQCKWSSTMDGQGTISDACEVIRTIYETNNISHSWIIYDSDIKSCNIDELVAELRSHDYPVFCLDDTSVNDIQDLENKYRMFIIEKNNLQDAVLAKGRDLCNISVVFCQHGTMNKMVNDILASDGMLLSPDLLFIC